jgi:hypothetical protein
MILRGLVLLLLVLAWIWGGFAILIAGPASLLVHIATLVIFIGAVPVVFYFSTTFWRAIIYQIGVFAILLIWWSTLSPTNDKDWAADVAHIPHGTIENNILTLHNVRNFNYRTEQDFDERWETRTYDLNQLESIDLFLSYWGSPHITHTIISWGFKNGDQLAVSIETRKDKTQQYSAIKGFFKQFTLAYVAADERDVIRKRTNIWKEEVYVYRLTVPKDRIRSSLESYVAHMNKLVNEPEFYHALTMNCTSTIRMHSETNPDRLPFDWRFVANGHVDKLLYDHKAIRYDLPFEQVRKQSRIDLAMQEKDGTDFSVSLRQAANIE